jgi:hypothetical protein
MLTTEGVTCLSIGASEGNGAPSTDTGSTAMAEADPESRTITKNNRLIAFFTLNSSMHQCVSDNNNRPQVRIGETRLIKMNMNCLKIFTCD